MTISAFAALEAKHALVAYDYSPKPLGPREIEIEISHCGICHSDIHLIDNDWANSVYPLVPGHEIVGIVREVGNECTLKAGEQVGVGWQRSACHVCENCLHGDENLCPKQEAICRGHMGGFANRIRTDERFAFPLPAGLEPAAAAPLLCAGATVFSPLLRWKIGANASVGVIGIGGLGHLAIRFLKALGCHTTAFTSSPDKHNDALRLGADAVVSSKNAREIMAQANHFEFLLCTVPARLDWIAYLQTLKPNGVLCFVGAPPGLVQFPASQLLSGQRVICGSDIGSPAAIRQMLAFAAQHRIGADVEVMPMVQVNEALLRVRENRARYRVVLAN